ncbi:MAG: hypothetical protein ACOY5V_17975 [Pseudomonadota bacterium]
MAMPVRRRRVRFRIAPVRRPGQRVALGCGAFWGAWACAHCKLHRRRIELFGASAAAKDNRADMAQTDDCLSMTRLHLIPVGTRPSFRIALHCSIASKHRKGVARALFCALR